MLHYWKRVEKAKRFQPIKEKTTFDPQDFVSADENPYGSYINLPFRKRTHIQRTRKLMDKQMQKYFDQADENYLNQTRTRSDKWRNLKSTYDSFMSLSPNERRRINTANMRGYQLDRNGKTLYSFEDNCVYNVKIGENFNKIIVISMNHKFTDVEKRNIFDNPYTYEPVSPYRIQWPSTDLKDTAQLSLIQIEQSLGRVTDAFNNISSVTESLGKTMTDFSSSVNNIAQQNVLIQQDFSNLLKKQKEEEEDKYEKPSELYIEKYGKGGVVRYCEDGHKPRSGEKTNHYTRGSKSYRQKIDVFDWVDDGNFIYSPEVEDERHSQQPISISNNIQQDNGAIAGIMSDVKDVLTQLKNTITQMYTTIINAAAEVRKSMMDETQQRENESQILLTDILDTIKTKLDNTKYDSALKELSDSYQTLAKAIKDQDEKWGERIADVCNKQNALFQKTEEQLQETVAKAAPNQEAIIPKIEMDPVVEEIRSLKQLFSVLNEQYASYLQQTQQINALLSTISRSDVAADLNNINTNITNSRQFFEGFFTNQQIKLLESEGQTRQLLTDNQNATNTIIQEGVNYISNSLNQNAITQTNILANNGQNILNQQAYSNWLMTNGFNALLTIQDKLYNAYRLLYNSPVTNKNLITDETASQKAILDSMQPNNRTALIEDANQITPAENQSYVEAISVENENKDKAEGMLEYFRDQFVFFIGILSNYVNDTNFIEFARQVGFRRLFNAYLMRNENQDIFNMFINLANRIEITPDIIQGMNSILSNVPVTISEEMEGIILKSLEKFKKI